MSGNLIELLHNSIETTSSNNLHLTNFLNSCLEHGSFYNQDKVEAVIKVVNSSLNSSFDKEKGLVLLQSFLSQISIDAFSSNAFSWMVNCNKIISQKEGAASALALNVLSKLIKLSVKFPEVNKEVAKQIVPKFFLDNVRRKSNPQVSVELLGCIQSCMLEYPGPSGEYRLDIQKLLLTTVEARREVVLAASRCVPLVAGVGGGGKQGVSHKTAWRRQQLGLVSLLHSLLNRLYEHVNCQMEENTSSLDEVELTLESVNERNILMKSQRLATQFSSVALFLQAMLLEEFPVAKAVAPDAILDVVAHAQKPTLATLGSSREALAVTAVLPTLQIAALRLLESLVLCLGRNLVPQAGLVGYLCSQVIHWSHQKLSDWPYAMDKPFSQTRLAAYCCLHSWLTTAGASCQLDTVADKLLPPMLADIHAEKPSIRLRVGSKAAKGKRKQQVLVSEEDRSEKLGNPTANHRLCERALLTLVALLRSAAVLLKPDIVSSITEIVLRLVADLPVPYSDANCLTALHQLLLTLCLAPHPRLVPPLPQALSVFTAGTHHPIASVKAFCIAALSSLDKVVHPTAASLYFPVVKNKQTEEDIVESNDMDNYNYNEESSMPALKKIRIETLGNAQSTNLMDTETEEEEIESNGQTIQIIEKEIKITECELTDSETLEFVHIEHPSQNEDHHELFNIDEESNDEEIDIIDITEEDEAHTEEGKSHQTDGLDVEKGTDSDVHSVEDSRSNTPLLTSVSENQLDSMRLETEKDQNSEEDADVSQMLMDFNDEVNDDTKK